MSDDRPKFIGVFEAPGAFYGKDSKYNGWHVWAIDERGNIYNLAGNSEATRFEWLQVRIDIVRPDGVGP